MSASFPILITSNNKVNNSTYEYTFPSTTDLSKYDIALSDLNIFYSWYNISASLNNNKFSINFPIAGTSNQLYNVTIPDGSYTVGQLNEYLQYYFIQNSLYLTNTSTGDNVYYMQFVENPNAYRVQLVSYPVPTSLPSGFTNGGSIVFPSTARQPIFVNNNVNFGKLIGFSLGSYPAVQTATNYSTNGDLVPQLSPVSAVLVHINCINNPLATSNELLHVFTSAGVQYGSLIASQPPEFTWAPCNGSYSSITVRFTDQNFTPLQVVDTELSIKLLFRPKNND